MGERALIGYRGVTSCGSERSLAVGAVTSRETGRSVPVGLGAPRGAPWRARALRSADWPAGLTGRGAPARPPSPRAAIGRPGGRPRGGGHVPAGAGVGRWGGGGDGEGGAAGGDWPGGARARRPRARRAGGRAGRRMRGAAGAGGDGGAGLMAAEAALR